MTIALQRSYLLTNKSNRLPVFPGFLTYDGNWNQSAVFLWFPFWHILLMLGHLRLLDFSPHTQLCWHISMETVYFLGGHAHYRYYMHIFIKDILLFSILFWKGSYQNQVVISYKSELVSDCHVCALKQRKKGRCLIIKSCNENCSVNHRGKQNVSTLKQSNGWWIERSTQEHWNKSVLCCKQLCSCKFVLRHQQIRVGKDRRTGKGFADPDVQLLWREMNRKEGLVVN